jgi:hypothetical protein
VKKVFLSFLVVLGVGYGAYAFLKPCAGKEMPSNMPAPADASAVSEESRAALLETPAEGALGWPLNDGGKREKKLGFGLHVAPGSENNPISPPERFSGYHAGLDFEIFPEEQEADVPVLAVCDGAVLGQGPIDGYGGVLTQRCLIEGDAVTVLYGHIDPERIKTEQGYVLKRGEELGFLAPAESEGSGFTRKHLHLALRKGLATAIPGYLDLESDLAQYLDPLPLLEGP